MTGKSRSRAPIFFCHIDDQNKGTLRRPSFQADIAKALDSNRPCVTSNGSGAFFFSELTTLDGSPWSEPPTTDHSRYYLLVEKSGYAPSMSKPFTPSEVPLEFSIALTRCAPRVIHVIDDSSNRPIQGARIELMYTHDRERRSYVIETGESDESGRLRLQDCPAFNNHLEVSAEGFETGTMAFFGLLGGEKTIRLKSDKTTIQLMGQVVDASGKAAPRYLISNQGQYVGGWIGLYAFDRDPKNLLENAPHSLLRNSYDSFSLIFLGGMPINPDDESTSSKDKRSVKAATQSTNLFA